MSNKRQRIQEPVRVDHLSHARDTVHKVSEFMTIQEMLIFRRCSKLSLFNIDRLKRVAAQRMRKMLEQRLQVPSELIDLVHELKGVFSGSAVLSCIYDDFQLEKDEKKNHKSDIDIFIPMSTKKQVCKWFTAQEDCKWTFKDKPFNWEEYTGSGDEEWREAKEGPLSSFPVYGICNALQKEEGLRMLQFVFLRNMAPRDYIVQSFDISLVRNWFDGKQFGIGVQDDVVTRSFTYRAQDYVKKKICNDLPKWRIEKYERFGFKCENPITTHETSREFKEETYKFKVSIVDGFIFDLHIYQGRAEVWMFDHEKLNFFIATARELGMPFAVDYEKRYITADTRTRYIMQRYYNA